MLEMVCRISLPRVRRICCLQRKKKVCFRDLRRDEGCTENLPDLIKYCVRQNVPFNVFSDWSEILAKVKEIVEGRTTVEDAAEDGYEQYKKGAAGVDE